MISIKNPKLHDTAKPAGRTNSIEMLRLILMEKLFLHMPQIFSVELNQYSTKIGLTIQQSNNDMIKSY